MDKIYVVVAENDQVSKYEPFDFDGDGPVVFETFINKGSLENAQQRIKILGNRYGICRIAELNFIDA